jgi:hypothetical protein
VQLRTGVSHVREAARGQQFGQQARAHSEARKLPPHWNIQAPTLAWPSNNFFRDFSVFRNRMLNLCNRDLPRDRSRCWARSGRRGERVLANKPMRRLRALGDAVQIWLDRLAIPSTHKDDSNAVSQSCCSNVSSLNHQLSLNCKRYPQLCRRQTSHWESGRRRKLNRDSQSSNPVRMVFSSDLDSSRVRVNGDVPSIQTIKSHLALTNAFFLFS